MGPFLILEQLGTGWNRLERMLQVFPEKKSVGIVFSHLVEETIYKYLERPGILELDTVLVSQALGVPKSLSTTNLVCYDGSLGP